MPGLSSQHCIRTQQGHARMKKIRTMTHHAVSRQRMPEETGPSWMPTMNAGVSSYGIRHTQCNGQIWICACVVAVAQLPSWASSCSPTR